MINEVIQQNKLEHESPLNFELILEELDGNKVLLLEIINRFINRVDIQLASLRAAVVNEDVEAIVFAAHAIHGGASSLRIGKLAELAFLLEKKNLIRDSSREENCRLCSELEAELNSLKAYIAGLF